MFKDSVSRNAGASATVAMTGAKTNGRPSALSSWLPSHALRNSNDIKAGLNSLATSSGRPSMFTLLMLTRAPARPSGEP